MSATGESLLTKKRLAAFVCLSIASVLLIRWRRKGEGRRRRKKNDNDINVGGIFGMDVGGTLTKIVYFEATFDSELTNALRASTSNSGSGGAGSSSSSDVLDDDSFNLVAKTTEEVKLEPSANSSTLKRSHSLKDLSTPDHQAALQQIYSYMDSAQQHPKVYIRDETLSFYSPHLGGRLHFLLFETRNMMSAINVLSSTAITENIRTVGCTGGGAHKYAHEFEEQLGITVTQQDELACLVRGMHFALTNVAGECYSYREDDIEVVSGASSGAPAATATQAASDASSSPHHPPEMKSRWQKDVKEHTKKVFIPYDSLSASNGKSAQFPYLLVNIGSGVSILKVYGPGKFERVSGSSLGGGTYWGLCRLLTRCESFEEVLDIAENGDATEVDMLVRDIYGGGYDGMNLSGAMVASSFGKLVMKDNPRSGIKEEDLAIALLMMITNNIGQVSYLNAQVHSCSKIFFVGSFLRHNPISCRRLAFAIDFWSRGLMEALFLAHEGYFGALGSFLIGGDLLAYDVGEEGSGGERGGNRSGPSASSSSGSDVSDVEKIFGITPEFLEKVKNWNPVNLISEKSTSVTATKTAPSGSAKLSPVATTKHKKGDDVGHRSRTRSADVETNGKRTVSETF